MACTHLRTIRAYWGVDRCGDSRKRLEKRWSSGPRSAQRIQLDSDSRVCWVPEGFHEVQWTRLAGGAASQEFIQHVSRLLTGHPDRPKPVPARPASESKSGPQLRTRLL